MYNATAVVTTLLGLYALFRALNISWQRQKANALGCQRAHMRVSRLPFGLDHILRLAKADRQGRVPRELKQIFLEQDRKTFREKVLGTTAIHTIEPKNIQALLATQFRDFELGSLRRQVLMPMIGHGIFTADGEYWEHSRALLRPQFARAQVENLDLEERHMQELFGQLPTDVQGWTQHVNIPQMVLRFTIDLATEFLFGTSVHSQRNSSLQHEASEIGSFPWKNLAQVLDSSSRHMQKRFRLQGLYWLHNPRGLQDDIKEIHHFADSCIQNAIKRAEKQMAGDECPGEGYIFLHELMKVTNDPIELRSQSLNILLAGRDTTASLVSWALWLLAKHPDVYNKLRFHILESFGAYEEKDRITFQSLKACKYLQYVMKEVLRLYPPTPINSRTAIRDTTLPHGGGPTGEDPIFVRKGQTVVYYIHVTQTLNEFWGMDADTFDPSRWMNYSKHDWTYVPFSGGPRACLGQQFALTQAGYLITRVIQKYDQARLVDPDMVPNHNLGITDAPNDYLLSFHETVNNQY